jgi:hypothetical protein
MYFTYSQNFTDHAWLFVLDYRYNMFLFLSAPIVKNFPFLKCLIITVWQVKSSTIYFSFRWKCTNSQQLQLFFYVH